MIRSMTGFGRAQAQLHGLEIAVELRSVNNRYLDCTVKLPRIYGFAEDAIKALVKKQVARGKVDVFLTVQNAGADEVAVSVNKPVLEGYLTALRQIRDDYGVADDITVMSLSRLPDVLTLQRREEDEEQVTADLLSVLEEALSRFNAMREKEGQALEDDVRAHAACVLERVAVVEARSPQTVTEYHNRLLKKLREVLGNTVVDENRVLNEAAIYADRVAVDEETVRLRSHISQLEDMLQSGGVVGRKLDFLLQEMNRETNTIGSKCSDLELSQTVVDIKAELEKIREQIQNIE